MHSGKNKRLGIWLRAIRLRFLLSSILSVIIGFTCSLVSSPTLNVMDSLLVIVGVLCLHISVDLLNDYWDFKRGIDTKTVRTKFSGGTGVLPEKLLSPRSVYRAGIFFLILGSIVGLHFTLYKGIIILMILVFAILTIYFYSSKIVNVGLGELFVGIKNFLIVIGTFYVQSESFSTLSIYSGIFAGMLSGTVLFANSFPDFNADKLQGRRTLVILLGKEKGAMLFPLFFIFIYVIIIGGVLLGVLKIPSLLTLLSIPFAINAIKMYRAYGNSNKIENIEKGMAYTAVFSRMTSSLFIISLLINLLPL